MLAQADPERAKMLLKAAQHEAEARWEFYEQVAGVAHRVVSQDGSLAPAAATLAGDAAGSAPAPAPANPENPPAARSQEATS
jgi:hypothetical protein